MKREIYFPADNTHCETRDLILQRPLVTAAHLTSLTHPSPQQLCSKSESSSMAPSANDLSVDHKYKSQKNHFHYLPQQCANFMEGQQHDNLHDCDDIYLKSDVLPQPARYLSPAAGHSPHGPDMDGRSRLFSDSSLYGRSPSVPKSPFSISDSEREESSETEEVRNKQALLTSLLLARGKLAQKSYQHNNYFKLYFQMCLLSSLKMWQICINSFFSPLKLLFANTTFSVNSFITLINQILPTFPILLSTILINLLAMIFSESYY